MGISVLTLVLPAQGHWGNHTEAGWIKPPNLLYETADTYWYMHALPTTANTEYKSEGRHSTPGEKDQVHCKVKLNLMNLNQIKITLLTFPKLFIYSNEGLFMGPSAKCAAMVEYASLSSLIVTGRPESNGLWVMVGGRLWSLAYTTHSDLFRL